MELKSRLFLFLIVLSFLFSGYRTIYNSQTGKLDYVGSGTAEDISIISADTASIDIVSTNTLYVAGTTNLTGLTTMTTSDSVKVSGDIASFDVISGSNVYVSGYYYGDGSMLTDVGTNAATTLTFTSKAGEGLYRGQAVYISGVTGSIPNVYKAYTTSSDKTRVVGLAATNATTGSALFVRRSGILSNVDSRTTNTNLNPLAQTWVAGDLLFATVSGGLTNVRPTTGRSVKAAYSLSGSGETDKLLAYPLENPVWHTAATGENNVLRAGDNWGVNKTSFRKFNNTEIASLDSMGNFWTSGDVIVSGSMKSQNGHMLYGPLNLTAAFDVSTNYPIILLDSTVFPKGIVITGWAVSSTDADPVTELDANLMFCDDPGTGEYPGASATLIDVLDTTAGNSSETNMAASSLGSGIIAVGKAIYIDIDADPTDATSYWILEIEYTIPSV